MIDRIARFAQAVPSRASALEDALGVVTIFALLFLGLTLSGTV